MRIVMWYHSLVSDWNHGNAHFLRGIVTELQARGHEVVVLEPENGWSRSNLLTRVGRHALSGFHAAYPTLQSTLYDPAKADVGRHLEGADVVLVHEWNDAALVAAIGRERAAGGYHLLFHDTHHRSVTEPDGMAGYDLSEYDGVLAFGEVIRHRYLDEGWAARVWTWHEAADVRVFRPLPDRPQEGDLVWIGNWGDGERTAELEEYLVTPAAALGLRTQVYGVRYPDDARARLAETHIDYRGWLPNYAVPETFARHAMTVHVPRRPYAIALPGIPTIRVFEALACGIPLVCAPWDDAEHLFTPGADYRVAENGAAMRSQLADLLNDREAAAAMSAHGRHTILQRHTCAHRVDELLAITASLDASLSEVPA